MLSQGARPDLIMADLELMQRAQAAEAVKTAREKATGEPVAVRIDSAGRLYVRPLNARPAASFGMLAALGLLAFVALGRIRP